LQIILCTQAERSEAYGTRGIIDGIVVLVFVWTAHRVGVAARLIQTDWETADGTDFGT
jgi:hypothetical protein